ncbi:MAG: ATP-binding protein [Acidimicrobiales bacterium]
MVGPGGRWDHRGIEPSTTDEHDAATPGAGGPCGWMWQGPGRAGAPGHPLGRRHRHGWRVPRRRGPLRRSTSDRMVAGVCGGVGAKFGIDPTVVRVVFALMSIGGGFGFGLYAVAWLFVPRDGSSGSIMSRAMADRRTVVLGVAFGTALVAVLVVLSVLGVTVASSLLWPLAVGGAALLVVWRGADEEEKAFLSGLGDEVPLLGSFGQGSALLAVIRIVVGIVLVAGGLSVLTVVHRSFFGGQTLIAAAVVLAGFVVAFGPWWMRIARDLADERRERVRAEERAEMAATVHDSVLQTLALIQKFSADPAEVTRLARAQERDLRSWLFDDRPPGTITETRLADAVAAIERDVEADHKVPVDAVVVGDCPLGEEVLALLAAGREAVVNAAKWSGAASVSIFVEAEPQQVSMFVRDRGRGFDPGEVPEDRKGVSESIRGRVARFGGQVRISSTPGEGTEVELVMPLSA